MRMVIFDHISFWKYIDRQEMFHVKHSSHMWAMSSSIARPVFSKSIMCEKMYFSRETFNEFYSCREEYWWEPVRFVYTDQLQFKSCLGLIRWCAFRWLPSEFAVIKFTVAKCFMWSIQIVFSIVNAIDRIFKIRIFDRTNMREMRDVSRETFSNFLLL